MGMCDYIDYTCHCPHCGHKVSGFQSKSGPCMSETLKPWAVFSFYTSCTNCRTWIEYTRKDSVSGNFFEDGHKAVKLLIEIQEQFLNLNPLTKDSDISKRLSEFLTKTVYPKDDISWISDYQAHYSFLNVPKERKN